MQRMPDCQRTTLYVERREGVPPRMFVGEVRQGQRYRVLTVLQVGLGRAYQLDPVETNGTPDILLESQCREGGEFRVQPDPSGFVYPNATGVMSHAEIEQLQGRAA